MAYLNKYLGIGRITNNLEPKTLPNGTVALNFSIAVNKKTRDKEETFFFDVQCYGVLAENISKYSEKGKELFVEGELIQHTWESNEKKQSKISILAHRVQFLNNK